MTRVTSDPNRKRAIEGVRKSVEVNPKNPILLWTLLNLLTDEVKSLAKGKERDDLEAEISDICRKLVEIVKKDEAEKDSSPRLPRLSDILCLAHNQLAWIGYGHATTKKDYNEAYEHTQKCIYFLQFALDQRPIPYYMDTKIRILLAMKDKKNADRAYELANDIHNKFQNSTDLGDILSSEGFKEWHKSHKK
jgi:hypothetical protein